jgi:hypothetical protein
MTESKIQISEGRQFDPGREHSFCLFWHFKHYFDTYTSTVDHRCSYDSSLDLSIVWWGSVVGVTLEG